MTVPAPAPGTKAQASYGHVIARIPVNGAVSPMALHTLRETSMDRKDIDTKEFTESGLYFR